MYLDEIIVYCIVQADIMSWDEQVSNYVWKLAVEIEIFLADMIIHWTCVIGSGCVKLFF